MPKAASLLLLLALVFTGLAGCTPTPAPIPTPTPEPEPTPPPAPLVITTRTVQRSTDNITVDLQIPVLSGLADTARQDELNADFAATAAAFADGLEEQADADAEFAAAEGFEFRPYDARTMFNVPYNRDGRFSLTVTYSDYTGGAHGMYARATLNLDTATGNELTLADLFPDDPDYLRTIRDELLRQITAEPDHYFPDAAESLATIPANQSFYLQGDTVVVYFSLYEIAPYAAGMPEFVIPLPPAD